MVTARNVQRALELVGRTPAEEFQTLEQWTFGDYLYATSALSGKLWVYDITNPAAPMKVDALSFDARILNDVSVTADGKIGVLTPRGRVEPQERHRLSRHVRPGASRRCCRSTPRRCPAACTARSSTATTST